MAKLNCIRLQGIQCLIFVIMFLQIYAVRRYSPLLVEDDGSRKNNRPAGELF